MMWELLEHCPAPVWRGGCASARLFCQGEGEGDKEQESDGPKGSLHTESQVGLKESWISEEGEQGAGVGESEEAEPDSAGLSCGIGLSLREPKLQERAGGGEQKKGKANGAGEVAKDGEDGMVDAAERRMDEPRKYQCKQSSNERTDVNTSLQASIGQAGEPVGVEIAEQERGLEEDQAGEPDGG